MWRLSSCNGYVIKCRSWLGKVIVYCWPVSEVFTGIRRNHGVLRDHIAINPIDSIIQKCKPAHETCSETTCFLSENSRTHLRLISGDFQTVSNPMGISDIPFSAIMAFSEKGFREFSPQAHVHNVGIPDNNV